MVKFDKITNDNEFNFVIEKLKGICRQQHFISDTEYFEHKSLWDNLFICPSDSCSFRTLYYSQYLQHIDQGYHVTDPRQGLNIPIKKPVVREIEIEDEDDTQEETLPED